jgi:hypothetical protein
MKLCIFLILHLAFLLLLVGAEEKTAAKDPPTKAAEEAIEKTAEKPVEKSEDEKEADGDGTDATAERKKRSHADDNRRHSDDRGDGDGGRDSDGGDGDGRPSDEPEDRADSEDQPCAHGADACDSDTMRRLNDRFNEFNEKLQSGECDGNSRRGDDDGDDTRRRGDDDRRRGDDDRRRGDDDRRRRGDEGGRDSSFADPPAPPAPANDGDSDTSSSCVFGENCESFHGARKYCTHNIREVNQANMVACCSLCRTTGNCNCWTWHNGGECWLKEECDRYTVGLEHVSGLPRKSQGSRQASCEECWLDYDTEVKDHDITGQSDFEVCTLAACCECCKTTTGCTTFMFKPDVANDTDSCGRCWLKYASGGERVPNNLYMVGYLTVVPKQTCNVTDGLYFDDENLWDQGMWGVTPAECCQSCSETAFCAAWSWTTKQGGFCEFKKSLDLPNNNVPGFQATSGTPDLNYGLPPNPFP